MRSSGHAQASSMRAGWNPNRTPRTHLPTYPIPTYPIDPPRTHLSTGTACTHKPLTAQASDSRIPIRPPCVRAHTHIAPAAAGSKTYPPVSARPQPPPHRRPAAPPAAPQEPARSRRPGTPEPPRPSLLCLATTRTEAVPSKYDHIRFPKIAYEVAICADSRVVKDIVFIPNHMYQPGDVQA